MKKVDLAIVGTGVSGTYFTGQLLKHRAFGLEDGRIQSLAYIDRHEKHGPGLTYGANAGVDTFAITRLSSVFKGKDLEAFLEWLAGRMAREDDFIRKQTSRSHVLAAWHEQNKHAIQKCDFKELYIPRFWIGEYLEEVFSGFRQHIADSGADIHSYNHVELCKISRSENQGFILTFKDGSQMEAAAVVLAPGIPPKSNSWRHLSGEEGYINDLYNPSVDDTMDALERMLEQDARVLIIGSNASALECLNLIYHRKNLLSKLGQVTCLSPSGALPEVLTAGKETAPQFHRTEEAIQAKASASSLVDAAIADIDALMAEGYPINQVMTVISLVVPAVLKMDDGEKAVFMRDAGMRLLRRTKRGSGYYLETAERLGQLGKFSIAAGEVTSISKTPDNRFAVQCKGAAASAGPESFDAVIDCGPSGHIETRISPLFESLLTGDNPLISLNPGRRGFAVDRNFETQTPGLFVFGPLLAGYHDEEKMIIHLETTSGIIALSRAHGAQATDRILTYLSRVKMAGAALVTHP